MDVSSELIPTGRSAAFARGDRYKANRRNATDRHHILLRWNKRIYRGQGDISITIFPRGWRGREIAAHRTEKYGLRLGDNRIFRQVIRPPLLYRDSHRLLDVFRLLAAGEDHEAEAAGFGAGRDLELDRGGGLFGDLHLQIVLPVGEV